MFTVIKRKYMDFHQLVWFELSRMIVFTEKQQPPMYPETSGRSIMQSSFFLSSSRKVLAWHVWVQLSYLTLAVKTCSAFYQLVSTDCCVPLNEAFFYFSHWKQINSPRLHQRSEPVRSCTWNLKPEFFRRVWWLYTRAHLPKPQSFGYL